MPPSPAPIERVKRISSIPILGGIARLQQLRCEALGLSPPSTVRQSSISDQSLPLDSRRFESSCIDAIESDSGGVASSGGVARMAALMSATTFVGSTTA